LTGGEGQGTPPNRGKTPRVKKKEKTPGWAKKNKACFGPKGKPPLGNKKRRGEIQIGRDKRGAEERGGRGGKSARKKNTNKKA